LPTERNQICSLRLVYPPISNQEAEHLMHEPAAADELRQSNIYMIVSRAEAKFLDLRGNPEDLSLSLTFMTGDGARDEAFIRVDELPGVADAEMARLRLECGDKIIRVYGEQDGAEDELLQWFTTEKLLFDRWQGMPGLYGLDKRRELTTYELLYVGISKVEDAFERLLRQPHDKRLRILANEPQKSPGARVTDETYLLFFKTDVLRIHTLAPDTDFYAEFAFPPNLRDPRIVADAEKAFVHFIEGRYNTVKYRQYPRGADGLFGADLRRYGYVIAEDLTLRGAAGTIRGAYHRDLPNANGADAIFVEGEAATLLTTEAMASPGAVPDSLHLRSDDGNDTPP
jgi:hypothetical protein